MSWDPEVFREKLAERLDRFDWAGASALCDELIAHLGARSKAEPYPTGEAKRILNMLRKKRRFGLMQNVAEALMDSVENTLQIRRQYAQSLIDGGNTTDALIELESLIADTEGDPGENAEARGLRGRTYKQLYVNARNPTSRLNRNNLDRAVRSYLEVYDMNPGEHLWPGINAVALLLRARRDGVKLEGYPDPSELASKILARVKEKDADSKAEQWDYATAAEACIALDRPEEGFKWIGKYIRAEYADAFELASTLRQLTEVWQLDETSGIGAALLPPLRTELLEREGGAVALTVEEMSIGNQASPISKDEYESVLGNDYYNSYEWYMKGADRCRQVARIGVERSKGRGTGFLMRGSDLKKEWGDDPVLVTNAHVTSNDEKVKCSVRPDEAVITFEALCPDEYRIEEILWTSPPEKLDATIVKLNKPVPCASFYPVAQFLPPVEASQRILVIGHPDGGTLSISLQDNLLLGHKDPRIHYRTPTSKGSSGSPVFNRQWYLIGLHHAGGQAMPRLDGSGKYPANEGIWIGAIIKAISEEP